MVRPKTHQEYATFSFTHTQLSSLTLLHDGENVVFTDLNLENTYHKLAKDDVLACAIGLNGKNLSERLTYEFACEEYVIA